MRAASAPTAASVHAAPPIPNIATSSRSQRSNTACSPAWAASAWRVVASSTRPGREEALDAAPSASATRRNGSRGGVLNQKPPARGTTVAATGLSVSAIASAAAEIAAPSPIPTTVPSRTPSSEYLGGQPADAPSGQVLRSGERRGKVDGAEPEGVTERVGGRRIGGAPVDDPDLDDAFGAGLLEELRDLRPGDAKQLCDPALGLAQLVVQAARPNQRLELAHGVPRHDRHLCTIQMCITGMVGSPWASVNQRAGGRSA